MSDPRRHPPVTAHDIAESAAYAVAAADDPTRGAFQDAMAILRAQCEALGLMTIYPRDSRGRYSVIPRPPRKGHHAHD